MEQNNENKMKEALRIVMDDPNVELDFYSEFNDEIPDIKEIIRYNDDISS